MLNRHSSTQAQRGPKGPKDQVAQRAPGVPGALGAQGPEGPTCQFGVIWGLRGICARGLDCMVPRRPLGRPISPQTLPENHFTGISNFPKNCLAPLALHGACLLPFVGPWAYLPCLFGVPAAVIYPQGSSEVTIELPSCQLPKCVCFLVSGCTCASIPVLAK